MGMLRSTMQGLESAIEIGDTATVQKILDVVPEQTLCEMRNHGTFPKATFCPSFSEKDVLEECVGTAVAYNWIDIVAILNNFIREHKLSLDKEEVLQAIYYAKCRISNQRRVDCCMTYRPYDRSLVPEYWHIFESKSA